MSSKAVSEYYRPLSPLYGEKVRVDVDRLIGYLSVSISNSKKVLDEPSGTMFEDEKLYKQLEEQADFYETMLNLILKNEFQ